MQMQPFFSHKMLLTQYLVVHKVLKVQLYLKKKKKKAADFSQLHLYVAIRVWRGEKGVSSCVSGASECRKRGDSTVRTFSCRNKNITFAKSVLRVIQFYSEILLFNDPFKFNLIILSNWMKCPSLSVWLVSENPDFQCLLSQLSSFLVESEHEKFSEISVHFPHPC